MGKVKFLVGLAVMLVLLGVSSLQADKEYSPEGKGKKHPKRRAGIRALMMKSCDGAEEEMERHKKAVKAIHEKRREIFKGIKGEVKETDDEGRKAIKERVKGQMIDINKELVEEHANHMEKMASLLKASKNKIAEKMFAAGKHLRHKNRGGKGSNKDGKKGEKRGGKRRGFDKADE